MFKAQELYLDKYQVDITSIFSTSTLSLKIFRKHFLKDIKIPILKKSEDQFIRESYYGGSTDYYKLYMEKGHYYDVNSLYPFNMCNLMPHELIKKHYNNININSFFGFIKCEVLCPTNMERPVLPIKYNNKTIYPHGK